MKNERKIVKDKCLTINDNVLRSGNTLVQLSNISKIDILSNYSVIICILILLFISLITGFYCYNEKAYKILPFIIIWFVMCLGFLWDKIGQRYLVIELNSGSVLLFLCYDEFFLKKVVDTLTYVLNNNKKSIVINFGNCQIGNSNRIN